MNACTAGAKRAQVWRYARRYQQPLVELYFYRLIALHERSEHGRESVLTVKYKRREGVKKM
jgi:hypothetical protein